MKAAYYEGPGRFYLKDVPEPTITSPFEVIIEVEVVGLCGTDLHIVSVPQMHPATDGIVLGHEFVGRVVETGKEGRSLAVGDRVIAGPNIWCGMCRDCRRGIRKMCENNQALGITKNGGLARYVVAPARVLYPIPETLSSEEAVFAEPLSCILNGFHQIGTCYGDRVIVLGAGPIGLYFIRLFRYFGATEILVSEPHNARRREALRSGATSAFEPSEDLKEEMRERTKGGADVVVDTTGFLIRDAIRMARKGGKILIFGLDATCEATIRPYEIVREEKSVMGCFIDNDKIPRCLELIPQLKLWELVSHRFPLDQIEKGMDALRSADAIKALIFPQK